MPGHAPIWELPIRSAWAFNRCPMSRLRRLSLSGPPERVTLVPADMKGVVDGGLEIRFRLLGQSDFAPGSRSFALWRERGPGFRRGARGRERAWSWATASRFGCGARGICPARQRLHGDLRQRRGRDRDHADRAGQHGAIRATRAVGPSAFGAACFGSDPCSRIWPAAASPPSRRRLSASFDYAKPLGPAQNSDTRRRFKRLPAAGAR
jgi:hypothetical protein